jgi:putative Mg2+ transporter-C (MgtC) family protein
MLPHATLTSAGAKRQDDRLGPCCCVGGAFLGPVPLEVMPWSDISRVMQSRITGIGFIGSGAILRWNKEHEAHGLTMGAGGWMTAVIGVAAGSVPFSTAV